METSILDVIGKNLEELIVEGMEMFMFIILCVLVFWGLSWINKGKKKH